MVLGTDVGGSALAMPDLVPSGARRRAGSARGDGAGGLPGPREEVADPLGGVVGNPGKEVGEPSLEVDVVQLGGADQGDLVARIGRLASGEHRRHKKPAPASQAR